MRCDPIPCPKGFVPQPGNTDEDLTATAEYVNPAEVLPGAWLCTTHRHTMAYDSGDTIVVETTMTNIVANQGLSDLLFAIPAQ